MVTLVLASAPAVAVSQAGGSSSPPPLLVVRFEATSGRAARQAALSRHQLTIVDRIAGTDFVLVGSRRPPDATAVADDPAVAEAHPPAAVRALGAVAGATAPNDDLFRAQWHLHAIGIPRAWDVSTGTGVVVAVLDTGVAYEDYGPFRKAPDLAGTRFVPGWDFVDNDDHPNDVPIAGKGSHGTAMAGTIAQTSNNGIGGAGVAPGAAIMPVRVLSPDERGTSFNIAKGLRFAADNGADVANLSLGAPVDAPELADAVAYAVSKGVTVIASSGDDGLPSVTYPAAYPDVLAVGAVRYDNIRAGYSNYGDALDLVAPGGDLGHDRNDDDLDDGVVQQALYESSSAFCFCFREGTSSAAAHVSGVAALVLAAGRATSPAEVRNVLLSSAAPLGPADEYGGGLVQATRALGMAPLPGETAPTTAHDDHHGHDHEHAEENGGHEDEQGARTAPPTTDPVLGGVAPEDGSEADTGVAAWLRRRRVGLAVVAGLVLLPLLAGAAGRWRSRPRAPGPPPEA